MALYIHVPFCQRKCIYCDFYSTTRTGLLPRYLEALQQEIGFYQRSPYFSGKPLSSIYWGGGTPSLLHPEQIQELLLKIRSAWPVQPDAEITLEANPGALESTHLAGYRQAGINRLSLGIQSFHERELSLLTRIHSVAEAVTAVAAARSAGFTNLSLDLIFGLPGQALAEWDYSLQQAIALKPDHLSLYGLTIEPGTPLFMAMQQGELQPCDEELERAMFLAGKERLETAGFGHYEISNYALPGREARHNQHYWAGSAYLGVGPAAHSFAAGERWWNGRDIDNYVESWEKGEPAVAGREKLSPEEEKTEVLLLGLRRRAGIDLELWKQRFGESLLERAAAALDKLGGCSQGSVPFADAAGAELLTLTDGRLALTRAGVLLSDMICKEIYAAIAA